MADPEVIELPSFKAINEAIGAGISAFANTEFAATHLFGKMMYPAPYYQSLATLGAARNVEVKHRIILAVADVRLTGSLLSVTKHLMSEQKDRFALRNKLAHWQVGHWHRKMPVSRHTDAREFQVRLMPFLGAPGRFDIKPKDTVTITQIEEFTTKCHKLTAGLLDLSIAVEKAIDKANEAGKLYSAKIDG